MVSRDYKSAAKEDSRLSEKLPPLRVILPWKTRPENSLKGTPLEAGARDAQPKVESTDPIPLPVFPDGAKVELIDRIKRSIDPDQSFQSVDPNTPSPAELHRLYAGTSVPEHRYLSPSLTAAVRSPEIARDPAKWLSDVPDIDLAKVVNSWLRTNGSTQYEQLYCIGLDPHTGQLTGMLTVKQGIGYSGGPCTGGSREYVAFWVDWGSGFEYEGTASVPVYDFGWLPVAGLEYNVSLPLDLLSRMQRCDRGAKTVKVRAVLSWNAPPSTTDPNASVVWGNRVEAQVLIPTAYAARGDNQVPGLVTDRATEIDRTAADGRIVDAAIKALRGMAFGRYAGLTIAPESAFGREGETNRSFAIDAKEIEDGGTTFTLYVSSRSSVHRGITTSLNFASDRFCLQEKN